MKAHNEKKKTDNAEAVLRVAEDILFTFINAIGSHI
jgi:hypothetical protein